MSIHTAPLWPCGSVVWSSSSESIVFLLYTSLYIRSVVSSYNRSNMGNKNDLGCNDFYLRASSITFSPRLCTCFHLYREI